MTEKYPTALRQAKKDARQRHLALLRQLGWIPDGPLHWRNPKINPVTGKGITYTTADAISLLKLRGELKRPGHSWAIGKNI